MSRFSKATLPILFYAIVSILLFFANYFHFNVDDEFEFWSLLFLVVAISFSYAYLFFQMSAQKFQLEKKFMQWIPVAGVFFVALYFFLPHPEYFVNDLNIYFFHGKIFSFYHANPYYAPPVEFLADPGFFLVKTWSRQFFNYGPLWLLITSVAPLITLESIVGALVLKIISLLFFFGTVAFAFQLFGRDLLTLAPASAGLRRKKIFLFAVHPIFLFWAVAGGHNDIAMVFFLVASLYFLQKEKFFLAFVFLGLSALIKYPGILLLPLYCAYASKKQGLFRAFLYALFFTAVVFAPYIPFQVGWKEIFSESTLVNPRLSGPLFSGTYLLLNGSLEFQREIFQEMKMWHMWIFLGGYGALLYFFRKHLADFFGFMKASFFVFLWFFFASFWFQPWYMIWILPIMFFLPFSERTSALAHGALIFYSLSFYILSYTFSSALGFFVTVSLWLCATALGKFFPTD